MSKNTQKGFEKYAKKHNITDRFGSDDNTYYDAKHAFESGYELAHNNKGDNMAHDYDRNIHQNRDAMAWTKFFVKTVKENNLTLDQLLDESYMIGWFANAMMAMHDSLYHTKIAGLESKIEKLKSLVLLTDSSVSHFVVSPEALVQWNEYIKCFPDEG